MMFILFYRFVVALSGSISVVSVAPFEASAPQVVFGFDQYAWLHRE